MSIRPWAEWWANSGFRIFPITPDAKYPPIFKHFGGRATTHIEAIVDWWTTNPMYNIGVVMDGLVCIDVDLYKNPDALEELSIFGIDKNQTLCQRTARGGLHLVYLSAQQYKSKPDRFNGVDIKSGPDAYILGGGSTYEGKPYEILNNVMPVPLPPEMAAILTPWGPAEQAAAAQQQLATKIDDPASIAAFANFCLTMHPAIQGQHGDHQTFIVAAQGVKDLALSPRATYEIMLRYYNPRCVPPWDKLELQAKVLNGYEYGTHAVGGLAPSLLFQSARLAKAGLYPQPKRRVDWLVEELLIPGQVTVLAGASGVGKSSLIATVIAHMISGHSMGPFVVQRPTAVITLNTEDDEWISHNRIAAVFKQYDWPIDEVAQKNVLVLDKEETADEPLALMERGGRIVVNPRFEDRISLWVSILPHAKALFLDALPNLHEGNENDNGEMAQVMTVLNRIASRFDLAILVAHHAGKGEASVRGASSITGRPRLAYTAAPHESKANSLTLTQVKKTHGARMAAHELDRHVTKLADDGEEWTVTVFAGTSKQAAEDERVKYLTALANWMSVSGQTMVSESGAAQYLTGMFPDMIYNQFRRRGQEPGKLRRWLAGRPLSIPLTKIDGTSVMATLQLAEKGITLI